MKYNKGVNLKNYTAGITLIALVITIIVLLILAGVTIAMLTGENGILNKTESSKLETITAKEKEEIKLAYNLVKAEKLQKGETDGIKGAQLSAQININDINRAEIKGDNPIVVTFKDTNNSYQIYENGEIQGPQQGEIQYEGEKPLLTKDMTRIKWDGTDEVITTSEDTNWYNYKTNKWANVKTNDGSYFVWIPRFEYKITNEVKDVTNAGTIDIKLISKSQTTASEGYTIHSAFTNDINNGGWDKEIAGFWVAKYEIAMEKDGMAIITEDEVTANVLSKNAGNSENISLVSKPGLTSWKYINIGNCYTNSYNYDREKESHLIKNSEWGAVAYLTHSKYGRNGKEVTMNGDVDFNTGGGTGEAYKTNINQTSTGNITGIYDLNGGAWEYVATWNTKASDPNDNFTRYGSSFASKNGSSTKYATTYINETDTRYGEPPMNSVSKIGDAIKEVYVENGNGWFNDYAHYTSSVNPFMVRSGSYKVIPELTFSGIFASSDTYGGSNIAHTYRITLIL